MNSEYANGFSCAINDDKTEVVISFFKTVPILDETGNMSEQSCDNVGTIIMNVSNAENLAESIYEIINNTSITK